MVWSVGEVDDKGKLEGVALGEDVGWKEELTSSRVAGKSTVHAVLHRVTVYTHIMLLTTCYLDLRQSSIQWSH